MSSSTAVVARKDLQDTLQRYSEKIAVFGVNPQRYIEAALMACVKVPELFKCTPESIALALRQAAQTGLEIGRTAHLLPYGTTATFVPDYKGLIELATATGKVASIRTRAVYEGEVFVYEETIAGPDLRHTPRMAGSGGKIVGAYAIADLRYNRYKVEWMTAAEIDAIRSKSRSWSKGELPDWYARKTVVRRLCKTLPMHAKLQEALQHDDAEVETVTNLDDVPYAEAEIMPGAGAIPDNRQDMPDPETALAAAKRYAKLPSQYGQEAA